MRSLLLVTSFVLAVATVGTQGACGKNDQPPAPTSGSPRATPETGPSTRPSGGGGGNAGGSTSEVATAMFRDVCATCHGASGKGDGPAAESLSPRPRNYTDPAWQASVTDDDIKKIIVEGGQAVGKSAMMPAQAQLKAKPEVLDELVKLIRGFGPKK